MKKLILFDIDGTLIDTRGAGLCALKEATEEMFHKEAPNFDIHGNTDSALVTHIFQHYGAAQDAETTEEFYSIYLKKLQTNLNAGNYKGRLLEGVVDLLESLRYREDIELSLLTGNLARGADVKLKRHEIDKYFSFGAFGDDHYDRNSLGPIALKRAELATGYPFEAKNTIIVGDTIRDIDCAKSLGCKVLAVATGAVSMDRLKLQGANMVLSAIGNTLQAYKFITGDDIDACGTNISTPEDL